MEKISISQNYTCNTVVTVYRGCRQYKIKANCPPISNNYEDLLVILRSNKKYTKRTTISYTNLLIQGQAFP